VTSRQRRGWRGGQACPPCTYLATPSGRAADANSRVSHLPEPRAGAGLPWTSADVTSPIRRRLDSAWCYESSPRSRQLGGSFPADLAGVAGPSLQSRSSSPFRREQAQSFLAGPYGTRETGNQIGRIPHLPWAIGFIQAGIAWRGLMSSMARRGPRRTGDLAGRDRRLPVGKPGAAVLHR